MICSIFLKIKETLITKTANAIKRLLEVAGIWK